MDTEDLLIGPRGRRLCLEWAKRLSAEQAVDGQDALGDALMITGNSLDSPGTSWIFVTKEHQDDPDPPVPPPSDPEEIAGLMSALRLRPPTDREALLMLAESIGSAMYWQPPWGEDRLAADEPIRGAMTPVAAVIAGCPASNWWGSPADLSSQWISQEILPDDPPGDPGTTDARALLGDGRRQAVEEERQFRDEYGGQDVSGTWWSIPPFRLTSSTRYMPGAGPVGVWLEEDSFCTDRTLATPLEIPPDPRILEITGAEDWTSLCARFPFDVTASRRYVWRETTGRTGGWLIPDWQAVAASGIDAVHLTVAGYLATAGRALPVTGTHSTVLAGWSPDATFWLVDVAAGDPVVWETDWESADVDHHRVAAG